MSETRIKADVVYQHDQLGEVLVTGIAKMYDEWDVSGPTEDIESGNILVFYYDNFDGYGGMNPMPLSDPVDEFAKACDEEVRDHDYIEVDYDEDES